MSETKVDSQEDRDPLVTVDSLRNDLRKLGATGMSMFVRNSSDTTHREYAAELIQHITHLKQKLG